MQNQYKMDVSIGTSRFMAEGPEDSVREDYQRFLDHLPRTGGSKLPDSLKCVFSQETDGRLRLKRLLADAYCLEDARNTILVLIYGYSQCGITEVPSSDILSALHEFEEMKHIDRVDRSVAPLIEKCFLKTSGVRRGTKYTITPEGVRVAKIVLLQSGLLEDWQEFTAQFKR